jgi:hypothetical protein
MSISKDASTPAFSVATPVTEPSFQSSNSTTETLKSSSAAGEDDSDKALAMSMPIFAGIAAGLVLTVVVVIILFLVKGKSPGRGKEKTEEEQEKANEADQRNEADKSIRVAENNLTQMKSNKEKEEAFGGAGNISVSFHPDHGGNEGEYYNNGIPNDKSSRGFLNNTDDTDRNGKPYNKTVALFSQQLKTIQQQSKGPLNIKEEIEKMKNTKVAKTYVRQTFAHALGNEPVDDRSSIKILDTERSKRSDVSAFKLAQKQSHNDMVVYTDGNREGPDESFYNQKIDFLKEEIVHMEQEKSQAKREEARLEQKIEHKKTQIKEAKDEEVDEIGMLYLDETVGYEHPKKEEVLNVKDHAVMTDYSHPMNIEILKRTKS